MLSARSVVVTAIVVAVLALLGSLISLLRPPDQGGLGADTYGTRATGYKAMFDTLAELGIDQQRGLAPPSEMLGKETTIVLWGPQSDLVQVEPVYLGRLSQWVRNGGRLIIAPQPLRDSSNSFHAPRPRDMIEPTTALREIGLPGVETKTIDVVGENDSRSDAEASHSRPDSSGSEEDSIKSQLDSYLFPQLFPTTSIAVKATGVCKSLSSGVSHLVVPTNLQVLDFGLMKPSGTFTIDLPHRNPTQEQKPVVLAAQFQLGDGEVIVVGDAAIFDNRLFPQADNPVLAARLFGQPNQKIVWDEFYHGLTVRGNPLFLLTRENYALVAVMTVAFVGVWVWRRAIFLGPPLSAATAARRSMGEYIDAMATFLYRGSDSLRFMLSELRHGVLWSVRRKFGLHRNHDSADDMAAALARRDPRAARQLLDAIATVELMLSHKSRTREREILQAAKDLVECL